MITRERIIVALVLVAVIAGFGAAYVFYFQGKMETYTTNNRFMDDLDKTYADLEATFSGYNPDGLISLWKQQVQPWADNRVQLATYYHLDDWRSHEAPPEEVAIVKFWYEEEAKRMEEDYRKYLFEKVGNYQGLFPYDIRATLGVKKLDEWQGVDVNVQQVRGQLSNLAFGINLVKFLVDNKVAAIRNMNVWPNRKEQNSARLLDFITVGLEVNMTMENFVKFMDSIRTSPRYFSVDAIEMDYPYIMYQQEPYINFKFLLTQAVYIGPREAEQAGGANAAAVFQSSAQTNRQGAALQVEEPGMMGKAWKWFKNNVLYMN